MRTSFGIFLRDLKALGRNPAALFVIIALLVLPGLYAWYCIVANWDPYSNTGNVPIAIVNEDEGASSDLTARSISANRSPTNFTTTITSTGVFTTAKKRRSRLRADLSATQRS